MNLVYLTFNYSLLAFIEFYANIIAFDLAIWTIKIT